MEEKRKDWLVISILIVLAIISLFYDCHMNKKIAQAYRLGYEEGYDAAIRTVGVKVEPNDDPGPGQYQEQPKHYVPTPAPQPDDDFISQPTPTPVSLTPTPIPPTPEQPSCDYSFVHDSEANID